MATAPADVPAEAAAQPAKKRLPLWLIIAIAAVVVVGAGGILAWHFAGASPSRQGTNTSSGPPLYLPLKPFVVNFKSGQEVRYLQVTIQVMSRDPKTIALLTQNDPMVRNDLLLLLGGQQYTALDTEAGKEQLRTQVLAAVRHVAQENGGRPEKVEAVYFTSFVMQ